MVRIGIIGYGYWGPNLVRNFSLLSDCQVSFVADARPERLKIVSKNYPSIQTSADADEIIANHAVDAVVIATPVFTHFPLAQKALKNAKHVLVEKPMTMTTAEGEDLISLAGKVKKILMVDHTFLYTGAVKKMKSLIENGTLGRINYFDSTRINLGLFQSDVNVLWDLATHDISILLHLVNEPPISVQAIGVSHTVNGIENIAYMTVNFHSNMIAHFNCSWTSPVKIRMILIGGEYKMIVFNDMDAAEKIKVYDSGYTVTSDEEKQKMLVDYRAGDIYVPKLDAKEALLGLAEDFVGSIRTGKEPISNAQIGLETVRILEAAQQSIKSNGKIIKIS